MSLQIKGDRSRSVAAKGFECLASAVEGESAP